MFRIFIVLLIIRILYDLFKFYLGDKILFHGLNVMILLQSLILLKLILE